MPIINMSESKMRNGSNPKCEGEVHKNVCDGVYVHLSVCMCVYVTVLEYQLKRLRQVASLKSLSSPKHCAYAALP